MWWRDVTCRVLRAQEESQAEAKALEAQSIHMECESDLAAAIPAVNAAIAALESLNKNDIIEVKSMTSPPTGVRMVLEAVCLLFGIEPKRIKPDVTRPLEIVLDYWEPSKRVLLSDPKLIQKLIEFDRDNVDARVIRTVGEFIMDPMLEPETILRASKAAAGICNWVRAIVEYSRVSSIVAPKRARLAVAEDELRELTNSLMEKRTQLDRVQAKLDDLAAKLRCAAQRVCLTCTRMRDLVKYLNVNVHVCVCRQCDATKTNIEMQIDFTNVKLRRAEQLISSVGGERQRWLENSRDKAQQLSCLPGNLMLVAATVAYLGEGLCLGRLVCRHRSP